MTLRSFVTEAGPSTHTLAVAVVSPDEDSLQNTLADVFAEQPIDIENRLGLGVDTDTLVALSGSGRENRRLHCG